MSKLEDKAVEIIDKSMIVVERLTEKMAELAAQYGPDVVNAGIEVARFTAAGKLLEGVGWAVLTGALIKVGVLWAVKARKWYDEDDTCPQAFAFAIGSGLVCVAAIPAFVAAIIPFFNIWNWVGIIEPKLWIAHRILEKAL